MENPMNTTINKNQTWCSMWGNAVSIAEHRPESYAKDITLRYPVYAPFDGTALRFTFDNYCGSEPVPCRNLQQHRLLFPEILP